MFKENFEPDQNQSEAETANKPTKEIKRRDFLKTIGIATGAVALNALIMPESYAGEDKETVEKKPTDREKFIENIRICFRTQKGTGHTVDFGKDGLGVIFNESKSDRNMALGIGKVPEENIKKINELIKPYAEYIKKLPKIIKVKIIESGREINNNEAQDIEANNGNVYQLDDAGKKRFYLIKKDKIAEFTKFSEEISDYIRKVEDFASGLLMNKFGEELTVQKETSLNEIKENAFEKLSNNVVKMRDTGGCKRYAYKTGDGKEAKYFIMRTLTEKEKKEFEQNKK